MRSPWLGLALLALAGAGTWWLLRGGAEEPTPPDTAAGEAAPRQPEPRARPMEGERRELDPSRATTGPERAARPEPAPAERPPPAAADPAAGVLELIVQDAPGHASVGAFRTTTWVRGRREERSHENGTAELAVPLDLELELVVEAEGFVPKGPLKLQVASAERRRKLVLELDRKAVLTGVVLTVLDPSGAPVPRVVVAARKKAEPGAPLATLLWERRCERPDGEYTLPELQPGEYRLDVSACDEAGDPLPLLPASVDTRFFGNEQVPHRVQLQSGALVRLSVADTGGNPLGTEALVRLLQGDRPIDATWRLRLDGVLSSRRGGLPGKGEALLAQAIPPGAYTLEVTTGPDRNASQPLVLAAGEVAKIRITLP